MNPAPLSFFLTPQGQIVAFQGRIDLRLRGWNYKRITQPRKNAICRAMGAK